MKRRLLLGTALWATLVLERPLTLSPYTAWFLSLPLLLWCGWPFHESFYRGLKAKRVDAGMLVSLSAWAAFIFSTPAVFMPDLLAPGVREHCLKTMAALIVLSILGKWIEQRFRKRTDLALEKLSRRIPATARVLRGDSEINLPLAEVAAGDRIVVRPGEQIPLDAEVAEGFSHVEESVWTGSEIPVEKSPGSRVLSGTLNKTAKLVLCVSTDGSSMALARIIDLVAQGVASKRTGLKLTDDLTRVFMPAAVSFAVIAALLWAWKGPEPRQSYAVTALFFTLAAACPWTLLLATPFSLLTGMRRAAELGVVVRNADILESLKRPDVLIVDKKGILTEGHPEVSEVICFGDWNEENLLRVAMGAERRSSHLFAEALRRRGHAASSASLQATLPRRGSDSASALVPEAFEAYPGRGVSATLEGRRVLVGSLSWLTQHGIEPGAQTRLSLQGRTDSLVGVAVDGQWAGAIAFLDRLRPGAAEDVRELEDMGIQVVLASGDRNVAAYRVAEQAGIGKVYAEVEQEEKVRIIAQLQDMGKNVAIIGEGLRDAPAISRADLGAVVARGVRGAAIDLALESADLVLERCDLRSLAAAIRLSERIRALNRRNLVCVFGWNAAFMPIAAGALFPAYGAGWSTAWIWGAGTLGFLSLYVNTRRFRRFTP